MSTILSVAKLNLNTLKSFYLQIDLNFDNRRNCAPAVASKLSRDILKICDKYGGSFVSPGRDFSTIHLIAHPDVFETSNDLAYFLKEQRIFVKLVEKCDTFSVEKCVSFTILYHLEMMKWFKLGDCYVQDGFLFWKSTNIPKITIVPNCSSTGELYLKFTAQLIRIYAFEHWLLDQDERFKDLESGPISKKVNSRWVTCLPKLGKGRLVMVHRKLPANSPFETYEQMKSYWKNSHGYLLPAEEPCVYYDVLFNNGETMLYPFYCVLTGNPETIKVRSDSSLLKNSLDAFLIDFENAQIQLSGVTLIPILKECKSVERYLDVVSMPANRSSKLKIVEKWTARKVAEDSREPAISTPRPLRKIYPMKRRVKEDSSSEIVPKSRPGAGISFE